MAKKKILICDDDPQRMEGWEKGLQKIKSVTDRFEVISIEQSEFRDSIRALEDRRRKARSNQSGDLKGTLIDNAAILVVDYDLIELFTDAYITGEDLSYLARCYSNCGFIVGLNQFGDNFFDLKLSGNPDSFADLNIGSAQLKNAGLWQEPWKGFRPWSWPILPEATMALERRVTATRENLDRPVTELLGLSPDIVNKLSRSAVQFLGQSTKPELTSVSEFSLKSDQGFRSKDKPYSESSIGRIAASRLSKWLERFVLSGQDILVDAPHLASRFPSLLKESRTKKASWNLTASFKGVRELGIHEKRIESARFRGKDWLSRPAWFLDELRDNKNIKEIADPWSISENPFVFCEDISSFLDIDQARSFVADLESQFVKRYVVNPSSNISSKLKSSLEDIDYRPQVRFAI